MKRIADFVIRLYPKAWRARYGSELKALLEDVNPNAGDLANVAWEATYMRITQGSYWRMLATFSVAGLGVAFIAGALTMPSLYESTATLREGSSPDKLAEAAQDVLSRRDL